MKDRPRRACVELDGHERAVGGNARGVSVGEDDAAGSVDLDDLAVDDDASRILDPDGPALARLDPGPLAPPLREARRIGEETENGLGPGADRDAALEKLGEVGHDERPFFSLGAAGRGAVGCEPPTGFPPPRRGPSGSKAPRPTWIPATCRGSRAPCGVRRSSETALPRAARRGRRLPARAGAARRRRSSRPGWRGGCRRRNARGPRRGGGFPGGAGRRGRRRRRPWH